MSYSVIAKLTILLVKHNDIILRAFPTININSLRPKVGLTLKGLRGW